MKTAMVVNWRRLGACCGTLAIAALSLGSLRCVGGTDASIAGQELGEASSNDGNSQVPEGCVALDYDFSFDSESYPETNTFTLDGPTDLAPGSGNLQAWLLDARWDDCGSLSVDGEVVVPDECDAQEPGDGRVQTFDSQEAGAPILLGSQGRQVEVSLTDLFPVRNSFRGTVLWCDPENSDFLQPPNGQNCVLKAENQSFTTEGPELPKTVEFSIDAPEDFMPEETDLDAYVVWANWDDCGTLGNVQDECASQQPGDGQQQYIGSPDNQEPILIYSTGRSVPGTLTDLFPTQAEFTGLVWWCEPVAPPVATAPTLVAAAVDHVPNDETLGALRVYIRNLANPGAPPTLVYEAIDGRAVPPFSEGRGTFREFGLVRNTCNQLRLIVEATNPVEGWTRSYSTAGNNEVEPRRFRWWATPDTAPLVPSLNNGRRYNLHADWRDGENTLEQSGSMFFTSFWGIRFPAAFPSEEYPFMWEGVQGLPNGCVDMNDVSEFYRQYSSFAEPSPGLAQACNERLCTTRGAPNCDAYCQGLNLGYSSCNAGTGLCE